jgi:hypothetical protein
LREAGARVKRSVEVKFAGVTVAPSLPFLNLAFLPADDKASGVLFGEDFGVTVGPVAALRAAAILPQSVCDIVRD